MNANYPIVFLISVLLTVIFTLLVKYLAGRFNIVDKPVLDRKIHKVSVPLLGGLAIFLAFFIMLYFTRGSLLAGNLEVHHWLGFFIGACLLMVGGFLDDKYNLKPSWQFIFPVLASLAVVAGGVEIGKITNPLGGFLYLDQWKIPITEWGGATRYFVVLSDLLIILWLLGMMYTTKLLDGLDGLVSGLGAIGGIIIFLFTITTKYYQPDIGLAALIFSACCLGFLFFNWHPAKIFLGEGGSLLLGFVLGVLAIISGGKIAIALLVMGIPILDVVWTIIRRLAAGKNPFKFADRGHLHFRLLDLGLGQRKTVLVFYLLAAVFGISGLFLQSLGKVLALLVLFVIMSVLVIGFSYVDRKKA
ncbi:MAG: MraY family glycosyltransferase [Patescibacteria group bacterium]|nr:MraY family glycosyltransferase [Patescibacteria group bacterium]